MTSARLYGTLQGALGTRNSSMLSAGSARKQATEDALTKPVCAARYAVMRILEELTASSSKLAATAWEMATEQEEDHSYTKSSGLGFRS